MCIRDRLKGVQIDYQWSCAMGIVMNRIPQLGKLSSNVWYCQGYSGHGIATTHIMGEIMAVSYTHLDVYKRQSRYGAGGACCWPVVRDPGRG